MGFESYMKNIKTKYGKSFDDFWKLAVKKGFVKKGKVAGTHKEKLKWLKSGMKLGHVYANMVIMYLKVRAKDPTVGKTMKKYILAGLKKK